jgi:hypothetical protein
MVVFTMVFLLLAILSDENGCLKISNHIFIFFNRKCKNYASRPPASRANVSRGVACSLSLNVSTRDRLCASVIAIPCQRYFEIGLNLHLSRPQKNKFRSMVINICLLLTLNKKNIISYSNSKIPA